jgi:hypothetical protein
VAGGLILLAAGYFLARPRQTSRNQGATKTRLEAPPPMYGGGKYQADVWPQSAPPVELDTEAPIQELPAPDSATKSKHSQLP